MTSQEILIALTVCIAFAAGALSTFVLIYDTGSSAVSLPQNIYGLPLSEMWTIVADQTGVENVTAVLGEAEIVTADDGSVESLNFDFYGENESRRHWYRVSVGPAGTITWDSHEIDKAPAGEHPFALFSEIERIPYRELVDEGAGLIVSVGALSGDVGYNAGYRPLFALSRGTIAPLERVAFSTDEPWYDIAVFYRTENSPSRKGTHYCTLLTLRDLDRAETVDYRDAEFSIGA
ncbi:MULTISPECIES: hypothetical protein [unclassified Methanoculleus]|uniref:Uncharacterized protein n=1 Tax=Methanoculleus palmolei TaxID=72612 RepID=A0ABD8A8X2_9EURY|nr:hypothetical protein [Methanoculleus sp. UBA377]MDD2472695.1 hypothetical protein [Methanoculleus sp.]WOX55958.1 hypothetical protein R6Y95_01150 [Methanoculleus palmolei]